MIGIPRPSADGRPSKGILGVVACGVLAIFVGVWLVWILLVGEIPAGASLDYGPGMEFGFHDLDVAILGSAVLGVGVGSRLERRASSVVLSLTGVLVLALALYQSVSVTGTDGAFGGVPAVFIVGPGLFVTLCGAVLLLLGGGLRLSAADSPRESQVPDGGDAQPRRTLLPSSVPAGVVGLVLVAIAGVVVGAWLEWLVAIPGATIAPADSGLASGPGLSLLDGALVGTTLLGSILAFVAATRSQWRQFATPLLLLAGLLAWIVPLWRLLEGIYLVETATYGSYYVAPGLYVTLFAGLLLVVASGHLSQSIDPSNGRRERSARTNSSDTGPGRWSRAVPWAAVAVATVGIGLVLVGAWLEWSVPLAVTFQEIPGILIGVGRADDLLFWVAMTGTPVSLSIATTHPRKRIGGVLLFLTGLATSALAVWWLVSATGTDGISPAGIALAPGVYVSLLGGLLLLLAGTLASRSNASSRSERSVAG